MWLNPIVKKDVKVQSRSMKICWGVFTYELILALVFFFAMIIIQQENSYSTNNLYSSLVWLYPVLAVTQLVILGVVVPVRTASSISGEKERQTFDIMMTTGMSPMSIILGKVMTAIVQSMFFVIASMPVMALCFVIGGMSWSYLFWFLAIALMVSIFAASIGILCSAVCKKSISAVIMSYGFYLVFFLGTILPYIIYQIVDNYRSYSYQSYQSAYRYGENFCLFFLLNPAVYLAEFFTQIMTGDSMVNDILYSSSRGPIRYVAVGHRWMVISTILFLAVSFLLLWLAARCINPMRKHTVKTKKKSKQTAQ